MKVLLSWLSEHLVNRPDWNEVFEKLTKSGIEVETVQNHLELEDRVVELKITPNRGDCLSILGLLREIFTVTGYNFNYKLDYKLQVENSAVVDVLVTAKNECPHYTCIVVEGVDNRRKLPEFINNRLTMSGVKLFSPIVDLANYVMLEVGQPLHTFDLNAVGGRLEVRLANNGETLELPDKTIANLTNDTLITCNVDGKPIAIAGVVGSSESGIKDGTSSIIIESAFFMPSIIASKAKQYGVSSDSAYRFERGCDFNGQESALLFAVYLITKYLGGKAGHTTSIKNTHADIYQKKEIKVTVDDIAYLIGVKIPLDVINEILSNLGFRVESNKLWLKVWAPSYRFDINVKEDIIEEIARIYGYDRIEASLPHANYTMLSASPSYFKVKYLKDILAYRGFNEIISYAFLEDDIVDLVNYLDVVPIRLKNSIAALSTLRVNLFGGLIKSMQYNLNRGATSIKLFELARVFYGENDNLQPLKLAGLSYGLGNKISWSEKDGKELDFFDLKGHVEILLQGIDKVKFVACNDNSVLHVGRCAKIIACGEREIGVIGQLDPLVAKKLELSGIPYLFELDVEFVLNNSTNFKIKSVSKFQKVERDLAFVVSESLEVGSIIDYIKMLSIEDLKDVRVFDVYSGINIKKGYKSIAIKLLFQADKTLTDNQINLHLEHIIQYVQDQFKVKLR